MPELNYVQGQDALERFCVTSPVGGIYYLHIPQFVIEGDDARSRLAFEARGRRIDEQGRATLTEANGYYDVAYRRTSERWRIRHRWTVYYDRGSRTVFGYEPTNAPFGAEHPALVPDTTYRDRR